MHQFRLVCRDYNNYFSHKFKWQVEKCLLYISGKLLSVCYGNEKIFYRLSDQILNLAIFDFHVGAKVYTGTTNTLLFMKIG